MFRLFKAVAVMLGGAVGLHAASARAESAGWLSVERGEGTSDCPGPGPLQEATEALLETPPPRERPLLHVHFQRQAGAFIAELRRSGETTARVLRDERAECETLAQAVTTTLALMLDTQAIAAPEEPRSAEQRRKLERPALPSTTASDERAATPESAEAHRLSVGAQGGAALGLVDAISPVFEAQLAFQAGAFRASVGGLWVPLQRTHLGPGYVEVELSAVATRGCLKLLDASVDLFACTGLFGGILAAQASGYTSDFSEARPWLALPVELSLGAPVVDGSSGALGWRAGTTLVVPARRQTFSVRGLGTAIEPARVSLLVWVGLDGALIW